MFKPSSTGADGPRREGLRGGSGKSEFTISVASADDSGWEGLCGGNKGPKFAKVRAATAGPGRTGDLADKGDPGRT